jgi:hypothetical protein
MVKRSSVIGDDLPDLFVLICQNPVGHSECSREENMIEWDALSGDGLRVMSILEEWAPHGLEDGCDCQ